MKPSPKPIRSSWWFSRMRQAVDEPEKLVVRTCPRCGKDTDMPFHACLADKQKIEEGRRQLPPENDRE